MNLNQNKYPVLFSITHPHELRQLKENNLFKLCEELRQFLLESVSNSSGHFASGLGVIELTVALHYVYNTPFDYLIWDIGHQAYPHKILTGRRDLISTIRQGHGLHPFPWREESKYDILSVGHSSTSISAGLGLAVAAEKEGLNRCTICVIGDGAITAGIAFEAMNHAGDIKPNLLVILNDNEMSISENVGALNKHMSEIISSKLYLNLREKGKKVLQNTPKLKNIVKYTEKHVKSILAPCTLFEELGFNYIGPMDGHNVLDIVHTLKNIRIIQGLQLLHVITKKGYGYKPAEKDPIKWHAVPKFDLKSGILPKQNKQHITYSEIFGNWLCATAEYDTKLIAITPAMCEGSGMKNFSKKYPNQYFDVAIAEQHAVTFAAGLAIAGYKPVISIYSTFLQRAYDQLIHDIAIQNLSVLFAIDRSGIVGADGPTHQGAFDLSYLRCIPNMVIMVPSDENECRLMLHTGYNYKIGPSAVRYPRGSGIGVKLHDLYELPLGKGVIRRKGNCIAILNFGTLLNQAYDVAQKFNATLIDMRFVKPLDGILLNKIIHDHKILITIEENAIMGGAGSSVNEFVMYNKLQASILNIGLPDYFIAQGTQDEIRSNLGLDSTGIYQQIKSWLNKSNKKY